MKSKLLLLAIVIMMLAAPSAFAQYVTDTVGITDTLALELTVDTIGMTAQMQMWVFSDEPIIGATVGYSWGQSPTDHFTIDTAYSPAAISPAFEFGPFYYENSNKTTTNTNQRFLFGFSVVTSSGVPGDASGRRLWATYDFVISQWDGYDADGIKIDTMHFNPGSLYLFVGDNNANFVPYFKGSVQFGNPDLAVGGNEPAKPETYALNQNYPNPFNPSTEISFDLPQKSHVKLTIYNILGQEVTTLIDREMNAQKGYSVTWNAGENASGVYFYKLTADNFTQTRKMMLLK